MMKKQTGCLPKNTGNLLFYPKLFKIMKSCLSLLFALFFLSITSANPAEKQDEKKNPKNQKDDWEVLFDGKSVKKWRGKSDAGFPAKGWKIENGLLFLDSKGGGDIITKEKY